MAPGKMLNLRGGSVSPNARPYDSSVIKVGGEVFDRDGYRMDVTVWFRHRNEVLYYLDSGGSVHGPMDQKHSTRLGNINRTGHSIPGSRHYLTDESYRQRSTRGHSESGAWDYRKESSFRGRTYSESRQQFSSDRSYGGPHYRTTASHQIQGSISPTHISRWSSMQSAGTQGLWRGPSTNRYATTLTRQHIKRHRDPVEMLIKHAPSIGTSKVDLVSIDNRHGSSPQLHISPSHTTTYHEYNTQMETDLTSDRERRLREELQQTRRELSDLKRTHSLSGDQNLLTSSRYGEKAKSSSTQYLNESSWTTHTLRKNEGQPCGARLATTPYRASSQTNITGRQQVDRPQWSSDLNLRSTTTYKQPPMISTYSAHRENMERHGEQRRVAEDRMASRYYDENRASGGAEVVEEVETITLQPIGRGVHDLEPTGSIARSYRANTPTASRSFGPNYDQSDGYRTITTTNVQRDMHPSAAPSPYTTSQHNAFYDGSSGMEHRYRSGEQHWRASTVPPNYAGSTSGASMYAEGTETNGVTLKQVQDTFRDWYLPAVTKEEVNDMLRNRDPGSFIIRDSVSRECSFSIGVKIPPSFGQPYSSSEHLKSGNVKHYMIGSVTRPDGQLEGVRLCDINDPRIFPGIVQFVYHHCRYPAPLPCHLRLPISTAPVRAMSVTHGSVGKHYGIRMMDMVYLGSVAVDRLEGSTAVRKAVTNLLGLHASSSNGLPKRCDVTVSVDAQTGIRFSDRGKLNTIDKRIKRSNLLFAGLDPESRKYGDPELRAQGMISAMTFGLVVRKNKVFIHENVVYVFAELDPNQPAAMLVNYIKQVFSK